MNAFTPTTPRTARELIGRKHEDRFERIMTGGWGFPSWFYGVRKATQTEDRHGVDFFAETDIGDIPLQVKSSARACEQHREEHHRHCGRDALSIEAVLVRDDFPDAQIRGDALGKLTARRERFFRSDSRFECVQNRGARR